MCVMGKNINYSLSVSSGAKGKADHQQGKEDNSAPELQRAQKAPGTLLVN